MQKSRKLGASFCVGKEEFIFLDQTLWTRIWCKKTSVNQSAFTESAWIW